MIKLIRPDNNQVILLSLKEWKRLEKKIKKDFSGQKKRKIVRLLYSHSYKQSSL